MIGSSENSINRGILTGIAALFEEIKGLKSKAKKAAVFGCYGWSGEGNKVLSASLRTAGFEVVGDGLRALSTPDVIAMASGRFFSRSPGPTIRNLCKNFPETTAAGRGFSVNMVPLQVADHGMQIGIRRCRHPQNSRSQLPKKGQLKVPCGKYCSADGGPDRRHENPRIRIRTWATSSTTARNPPDCATA